MSDTVGFIRKLPTQLVESFKSTLDEVHEADMLLHVVDIAHPNFEEHIESVNQLLSDIGAIDKPTLMIFNKIDAYQPEPLDDDDLTTSHNQALQFGGMATIMDGKYPRRCYFYFCPTENSHRQTKRVALPKVREIHIPDFPTTIFYTLKIKATYALQYQRPHELEVLARHCRRRQTAPRVAY